jgi:curli production assembly/transport component CsgG
VTLRAVSTNTGEVLASVSVHKMVASTSLQGGAFRYVMLDKILEAEAGVTQNEPKQIAVQEAIEKSVRALIVEGADLGVWSFRDPVAGRKVIDAYMKEKYGEKVTVAAETAPSPDTANPTHVVETVPARARPRPAPATPATPPPPAKGETVGSVSPDAPPPGAPNEVVGSAGAKTPDPVKTAAERHVGAVSVALN